MAENKKTVQQPGEEAEKALLSMLRDDKEEVCVRNKKYKIGALHKGTRVKVSEIMLDDEKRKKGKTDVTEEKTDEKASGEVVDDVNGAVFEDKVMAKIAAAYILNSWWSLCFLGGVVWEIYWRWLYYVRQYTDSDYLPLMILCKKKAEKETASYTNNITLATDMKMTTMMMTRKEVKRIQAERSGAQPGAAQ